MSKVGEVCSLRGAQSAEGGLEKGELLEGGLRSPLPGRGGEKVEELKGGLKGGLRRGGFSRGLQGGF